MIIQRNALEQLKEWNQSPTRKPLVLRGARQVGKSTLIEHFAKSNGLDLHNINLDITKLNLPKNINIDLLLKEIEALSEKKIGDNSIIFFDEIQKQMELFSYLRYFYEKRPDLKIIAAGSLLEFYIENLKGDIPVGRLQYYFLGPITFFEYLKSTGKKLLYEHLIEFINGKSETIHSRYHQQALEQFSIYLRVGGMPESTREYLKSNSIIKTNQIHQSIIQTYEDDFSKYAERSQLDKLNTLFRVIPSRVGEKIKWSQIDISVKARDLAKSFDLLCRARIMHRCVHTNATGLSLEGQADEKIFKPYLLDVGLMLSKLDFVQKPFDLHADAGEKGKIYEQFVAQMLILAKGPIYEPHLYYWLRDKSSNKAEVDFIIQFQGETIPIEVKNQPLGKMKSLKLFCNEKKIKMAVNFHLNEVQMDKIENTKIYRLPIYLSEKIYQILESQMTRTK